MNESEKLWNLMQLAMAVGDRQTFEQQMENKRKFYDEVNRIHRERAQKERAGDGR